ncbi:hypothetical protein HDU92_003924 [Lobulomyces angularis]|nr:hypothetical protein HDU92_003924 [Lobulomyces angularis]
MSSKKKEEKIETTEPNLFEGMKKKKKKKKVVEEEEPQQEEKIQHEEIQHEEDQRVAEEEKVAVEEDPDAMFADLKKKKKKKKKDFDLEQPTEESENTEQLTEDFGALLAGKKKKKKSRQNVDDFEALLKADGDEVQQENNQENYNSVNQNVDPWIGSNRDYTYQELLRRVFNIITESNPDRKDIGAYRIAPPSIHREGTKKTMFANLVDICKKMRRQPDHLIQYLFAELGTSGSIDGAERLIIKGRFQQKQIENVLKRYIVEYVTCKTCKSGETTLTKENRLFFLQCESCGSTRTVSAIKAGFKATTKDSRKGCRKWFDNVELFLCEKRKLKESGGFSPAPLLRALFLWNGYGLGLKRKEKEKNISGFASPKENILFVQNKGSPNSSVASKSANGNSFNNNTIYPLLTTKTVFDSDASLLTNADLHSPITVLAKDLGSNLKVLEISPVKTPVKWLLQELKTNSSPLIKEDRITPGKVGIPFWESTPMKISPLGFKDNLFSDQRELTCQLSAEESDEIIVMEKEFNWEVDKKSCFLSKSFGLGHWNNRKFNHEVENVFLSKPDKKLVNPNFIQKKLPEMQVLKRPVLFNAQKPAHQQHLHVKKKLQRSFSFNDSNFPNKARKNMDGVFKKTDRIFLDDNEEECSSIKYDLENLEIAEIDKKIVVNVKELVDEKTGVPYFLGKDTFKRITPKTLDKILNGEIASIPNEKLKIIDCRFPYEYEGGHVKGALNLNTFESLRRIFETNRDGYNDKALDENSFFVFHCEYSLQRAPDMVQEFRNLDRNFNLPQYPKLSYPNLFILDGGYKDFYLKYRSKHCFPCNYVEMKDKKLQASVKKTYNCNGKRGLRKWQSESYLRK